MKTINNLPALEWFNLRKFKDRRNAVLFTSPKAEKACHSYLRGINFTRKIYIQSADKTHVEKLAKKKIAAEVSYAVGGGKVIDVARFFAKVWGLEIICIPTMISSDAFLVDCTGLRENGCITYVQSKRADKVLLDRELLKKVPLKYHLSGCGDVLSVYTGSYDWYLASKNRKAKADKKYSPSIAAMAESILQSLIIEKDEIKKGTLRGLEAILRALILEVTLCNIYGNSRPEEGGEHFFTYCIENKTEHFLHGEVVSLGVLITAFLQDRDWKTIKEFMDSINLDYKPEVVTIEIVDATLQQMKNYVKKHKLPYSIYNEFDYEDKRSEINKFLRILKIKD